MNQILVIRFSSNHGYNQKLRAALANTFDPSVTPAFGMPAGGVISVLITQHSFEEILQIVKDADCGEPVQVTDCADVLTGIGSKTTIVYPAPQIESLGDDEIKVEISRLLEKRKTETLSEEEQDRLTQLITTT